jgi:hypothetical protein
MNFRIALWASVGVLVASGWFFYASVVPADAPVPMLWPLAFLTQPILFAGSYLHFGIKFYWVLLANAATYAFVGLLVEMMRRQHHPAR